MSEEFTLNEANKIVGNLKAITQKLEKMDLPNISKNLEIFQENIKNVNKIKKQVIVLAFIVGSLFTFLFLNFLYAEQVVFYKYHKKIVVNDSQLLIPTSIYNGGMSDDNKYFIIQQKPVK